MKTMLEVLRQRLDEVVSIGERQPLAHVTVRGYRPDGDPEHFFSAHVEDVGSDFLQIRGNMIDRSEILNVQPINF